MKVLVTGATGFIGHYVIQELLKKKVEIIATSTNLEKGRMKSWYDLVTYIPCDITNFPDDTFQYFREPDLAIHLAWGNLDNFRAMEHIEKHLFHHYSFIKNLVETGLSDITIAGTCLEYGLKDGSLSEELETNPVVSYGIAKDTLRKFLEELKKNNTFDLKWLRLFYMYGAGQHEKSIIPQLEAAIRNKDEVFNMSGGEQLRDYLPVEDLARYIVGISLQKKIFGTINCCSGNPISIRNLLEYRLKELNKNIVLNKGYYNYPDYEPMAFWGDNRKMNKILADEK